MFPSATSDWRLFSLKRSHSTTSDVPTGSNLKQTDSEGININIQQPISPISTSVALPLAAGAADVQDTVLPESDTAADCLSSDSHSNNSHPASPNEVSTGVAPIVQDQHPIHDAPDHPDSQTPPRDASLTPFDNLLMNARESEWMKSKKTLKYFREVYKMGKLSDLVTHWHSLKEALGFLETASHLIA